MYLLPFLIVYFIKFKSSKILLSSPTTIKFCVCLAEPGDVPGEVQLVEAPQDDVVDLHGVTGSERGPKEQQQ